MAKWRSLSLVLITILLLMSSIVTAQHQTDFSGHWSLVSAKSSGRGGGRGADSGNKKTMARDVSGAAINCGIECIISQDPKTLKISRSTAANQQGMKFPDVMLPLDGSESTVAQYLKTSAKWEGNKLIVTSSFAQLTATQTMSLDDGKLTVMTIFNDQNFPSLTLTYMKR